jgi:hypothetical protein
VNGLARQQTPVPPAVLRFKHVLRISVLGVAAAVVLYLLTNPYVLFNAPVNRDVLRSNFGNSLAMYEIARVGEGFGRAIELMVEGATLPIVVLGVLGLAAGLLRGSTAALPLAVPAMVFFMQFVLIGAGKPAEYGRFGVFPDTALAIGAACLLAASWTRIHPFMRWGVPLVVAAWTGMFGAAYLRNFQMDCGPAGSRGQLAERLAMAAAEARARGLRPTVVVAVEPAPYGCPPIDFANVDVVLTAHAVERPSSGGEQILITPVDGDTSLSAALRPFGMGPGPFAGFPRLTPISWANKSFMLQPPFAPRVRQDGGPD